MVCSQGCSLEFFLASRVSEDVPSAMYERDLVWQYAALMFLVLGGGVRLWPRACLLSDPSIWEVVQEAKVAFCGFCPL